MEQVKIQDLKWKSHMGGYSSLVEFQNGYSASVLRGGPFYTSGGTYEIAVIGPNGSIDYSTHITDDVLGYLTLDDANKALKDIAELPATS